MATSLALESYDSATDGYRREISALATGFAYVEAIKGWVKIS